MTAEHAALSDGAACPTCGCCTIGRMGRCVGGCAPRGGRSKHDRACRAECREPISPSQRLARRWREKARRDAARVGRTLTDQDEAGFAHLIGCLLCELRLNNDPDFCAEMDEILDGSDEEPGPV